MTNFEKLFSLLHKEEKRTGSDYTATVTRVQDGTAYVQITGADIMDTPVAMTIDAKAGDKVRVRIRDGKAWITGNDTSPPNNSTEQIKEALKQKSETDLKQYLPRAEAVKKAVVYRKNVVLTTGGATELTFDLPSDFHESYGLHIDMAWPLSTWAGANVTICRDYTMIDGIGGVQLFSGSTQQFYIVLSLLYV